MRRGVARAGRAAAVLSIPVIALALLVSMPESPLAVIDRRLVRAATEFTRTSPELRQTLILWQAAFQGRWVNLVGTGLCVWVWRRHGLSARALWAFLTLMVSWNLELVVKVVVQRTRPILEDAVVLVPGYSFPSGHAANAASAGLTLTLLVWPVLGPRARIAVPAVVVALVIGTALDRVFLGVHYPSDVIGGIALGSALAGASYLGYQRWNVAAAAPADEVGE